MSQKRAMFIMIACTAKTVFALDSDGYVWKLRSHNSDTGKTLAYVWDRVPMGRST